MATTDDVANVLYSTVRPWLSADSDRMVAADVTKAARATEAGTRETVLASVVALSVQHGWSDSVLEIARKRLVKMVNDKAQQNTLRTFASEIGTAAHPRVRGVFTTVVSAVNKAWEAEAPVDGEEAAERPLKVAFQRRYLTIMRCLVQAKEGRVLDSADKVIAFARENDPANNADKVLKRLRSAIGDLREIGADYPSGLIHQAAGMLETITVEQLLAAKMGAKPTTKPVIAPAPETENEPIEGPVDIDDILNSDTTLRQAA